MNLLTIILLTLCVSFLVLDIVLYIKDRLERRKEEKQI